jgi:transcriptional regulator with XRE-family HTH domain
MTLFPMNKEHIKEVFGQHITALRKERNLSIHQLAHAADLEYSHVQRIEKGKVNVELTTLLHLAQGLQVQPGVLLQFKL